MATEDKKEASNQTVSKEETTQKINETSNNTVVESTNKVVDEKIANVINKFLIEIDKLN